MRGVGAAQFQSDATSRSVAQASTPARISQEKLTVANDEEAAEELKLAEIKPDTRILKLFDLDRRRLADDQSAFLERKKLQPISVAESTQVAQLRKHLDRVLQRVPKETQAQARQNIQLRNSPAKKEEVSPDDGKILLGVLLFIAIGALGVARSNRRKSRKTSQRAAAENSVRSSPDLYVYTEDFCDGRKYCGFVDVETTGLYSSRHEIIEFALVVAQYVPDGAEPGLREVAACYTGLREPSSPIPPEASRVNHITNEMVRGQQLNTARILELLSRCDFIVAHNARFDSGFVCRLMPEFRQKPWLCSMESVDWQQEGAQNRKLQHLLRLRGIAIPGAHRALADALGCLMLLQGRSVDGKRLGAQLLSALPSAVDALPKRTKQRPQARGPTEA
jgi:DNA polymerase-3 subunit epsilon